MNLKISLFGTITAVLLGNFSASAQSVTGFSPPFGSVGDTIRIEGSGFYPGTTQVIFHNNKAASFFVASDSQINAVVPPGAVTGPITVKKGANQATSFEDFIVIGTGPYISSFSPIGGSGGTVVTLNGVHFTGVNSVKFNGTNGSIVQLTTDTQMRVSAPDGVTTGPITLSRTGYPSFTTSSNFFAPAVITSFSPTTGRPGTNVVIKGKNFLGTTAVKLNNVAVPNFTVDSNTQITMTLPVTATTGLININPPGGQANSSSNFVVLPSLFTFSPYFGTPGTDVTITGLNLVGNPVVRFNGVTGSIIGTPTAEQIVARVPGSATSGPISITTTNGMVSSSTNFFLPPIIINYNPVSGGAGTIVELSGYNFTNATDVSFNGVSASFSVVNNNTINATVPVGAMTGPISVTTPGGATNTGSYFATHPAVLGFNPPSGVPGTLVTINGSSFDHATAVLFNGASAEFTPGNNTQLTATVPTNATTGPISVVAPAGTGASAENFVVDVVSLSIRLLTNGPVVISWPTSAVGFSLQANTNLDFPTNWVAITNAPVIVGGKHTVTNSPTNSATFYRLKK